MNFDSEFSCNHEFHLYLRIFYEYAACPACAKRQRERKAGVPPPAPVSLFSPTSPPLSLFGETPLTTASTFTPTPKHLLVQPPPPRAKVRSFSIKSPPPGMFGPTANSSLLPPPSSQPFQMFRDLAPFPWTTAAASDSSVPPGQQPTA